MGVTVENSCSYQPDQIQFLPDLTRLRWLGELRQNLKENNALEIIDGTQPLPEHLTSRVNQEDQRYFIDWLTNSLDLSEQDLHKILSGKTIALTYLKFGDGHKFQAHDLAIHLAKSFGLKVVIFDPMEALSNREQDIIDRIKTLHKILQGNKREDKIASKEQLEKEIREKHYPLTFMNLCSKITDRIGLGLANIVLNVMPDEGSGNDNLNTERNQVVDTLLTLLSKNLPLGAKMVNMSVAMLTERSLACATVAIAAQYDADGIFTTHPMSIRAFTPDAFTWIPAHLWKKVHKALSNISAFVPDNGYRYVNVIEEKEKHYNLDKETRLKNVVLTSLFAYLPYPLRQLMPWYQNAVMGVADQEMVQSMHHNWEIPRQNLAEIGTIGDSMTIEQVIAKWQQPVKNILFALNGNGSNHYEFTTAISELGEKTSSPTLFMEQHGFDLTYFIGKHHNRLQDALDLLRANGFTEEDIETISYNEIYDEPNHPQTLTYDPNKKIHLILAEGPGSESEAKCMAQRLAHLEFRPPGETVLEAAKVGCLEFGTPTGGPNEPYNMIWACRHQIAVASNWPAYEGNSRFWTKSGLNPDNGTTPDDYETFPDLMNYYLGNSELAKRLLFQAYYNIDKQSIWAAMGVGLYGILKDSGVKLPERSVWHRMIKQYRQDRKATLTLNLEADPSTLLSPTPLPKTDLAGQSA